MLVINERREGWVSLTASDTLDRADYENVVPALEAELAKGPVKLKICLDGFTGWTAGGLAEDIELVVKHRSNFERIAVVGERKWEEAATKISAPLFDGPLKFFEDEQSAERWLLARD